MAKQPTATEQPFKDYYEILHLHAEADAAMVDQAYWHLARLYNAAIPNDPQAREKLEELNEAYSVLRSAELRSAYDDARNELLRQGLLTVGGSADEDPAGGGPPLAVMARQRPKPRKQTSPDEGAAAKPAARGKVRVSLGQLPMPPWQSALSAAVIFVLAIAAVVAGTPLLLVLALVIVGLVCTLVPIVRGLPRLPTLPSPTLHLPSVRAPHLPERHSEPSVDADVLRQSTAAMRKRWRVEPSESPLAFPKHAPWPDAPAGDADANKDDSPEA